MAETVLRSGIPYIYIYIYVCHCVNEINMYDINIIITYTCVWSLYPAPFAAAQCRGARGTACSNI
jgi:hypothetical protein